MSADKDDIFDDNFDEFENGDVRGGDDFAEDRASGGKSLLDVWNSNPLVKLAIIAGLVVIGIGSVYALVGSGKEEAAPSAIRGGVADSEAPGGMVSESYGNAIEEQNQQKLEQALGNRGVSAIPVPVNRDETGLSLDGSQDLQAEDPLAVWERENRTQELQPPAQQQQPVEQFVAPAPTPVQPPQEQMQDMSAAIAQQIQSILTNRAVKPGQYRMMTSESAFLQQRRAAQGAGGEAGNANVTGNLYTAAPLGTGTGGTQYQEILIPAGTILYGQIMNEANSDTPGPIIAQILSGPLSGARVIGTFQSINDKLIISFDKAVVNGVTTGVQAVAIDPSTTSPGLATDIDRRWMRRIVLPAAARFIEGLGQAYSQSETQVFTSGDVIVTQQDKLQTKQQLAKGVERGAERAAQILENEGDRLQPLIRVEAGTPVGIILTDPIMKPQGNARYKPEGL